MAACAGETWHCGVLEDLRGVECRRGNGGHSKMAGANGRSHDSGDIVRDIPGYRIERQLGRGSMGIVYLAEDVQLRRKVALKVLIPSLVEDQLFRKRFDRESRNAANLDHPSIVPVYAAGEAGGSLYIAMRYVSGGDLQALLETKGTLSLEQATSIIASVADALDAAHAQGMVHRDVKPANILFDGRNSQEHYYLSDFGITKTISPGTSLTSTGQIVGTIDYIAPEQIQGKPVDGRADLYALGCVLYHCLTGEVPFPREEAAAFMWAHVHEPPPPVTTRRPDLPPQVDHIVAKAMAKQPADRYTTCRELARALRAAATDPPAAATSTPVLPARPINSSPPPPVPAGMTSTYTPLSPTPARAPVTTSPPRRKWWWWAAGGVLALALIGGSTAAFLNYRSSQLLKAEQEAAQRAAAAAAAAQLDAAERDLRAQVPPALQKGCERDADAVRDTANVRAALICPPSGDVSEVKFTEFTSTKILEDRYNADMASKEIARDSGQCRNTGKAEGEYASELTKKRGRALCYPESGSSVIEWTEDGSSTLRVATRFDVDHAKLATWWGGVVGVQPPKPAPAPLPPPPAPPAPAQAESKQPAKLIMISTASTQNKLCLSSKGEGEVSMAKCEDGDHQKWELIDGDVVRNKLTGRCLDGNEEGKVSVEKCNSEERQKWDASIDGIFQNKQTGRCMTRDEEGGVSIKKCNGGNRQTWGATEVK